MLQEDRTKELFDYTINSLSKGSNKKVCIQCDYCQSEYEIPYKAYFKGREVVEKDACIKCKYNKRKDVSMAKYGVENSAQRPEVRKKISEKCEGFDQKRRDSMLKKYGVINAMDSQELKDKQKQTIQDKYGVDNVSQLPEVRKKVEETNLKKFGNKQFLASDYGKGQKIQGMRDKYGVDNAFQSEEIKKKIKAAHIESLGVEYPTQSKGVRDKAVKTNLDKYGVENPAQNEDVKNKTKETNVEKYGTENVAQNKEVIAKSRDTRVKNGHQILINNKDKKTIAKELDKAYTTLNYHIRKYGIEQALKIVSKNNALEQLMEDWLIECGVNYKKQFTVQNKRADFLLTDHNIIIETDGLYWHSDLFLDDNYHVDKHKLYIDNGYKPFFFREDEINNKFPIVKSIINNSLGNSTRIFARKCTIVPLSITESKAFFEVNHLMGKGRGTTYALKYDNTIVSAIIIRKIRNNDYDISRFCHTLNTQVVGSFSRLVKHFLRINNPDSLTTFIDKRYGNGGYLPSLNFKLETCYPSFKWTDTKETFHRMKFPGQTGYKNSLLKIWDCGQAKYVYYKH